MPNPKPKPTAKPLAKPKPRPKPNQGSPSQSSDPLSGILGALLGGGQAKPAAGSSADPMSDIFGSLLGGGGGSGGGALGSNAFLAPIVDSIARKIGIDPKLAEIVVSFVLPKLLAAQSGSKNAELSGLLDQMKSGRPIDQKTVDSTGLASELASQSGLDNETASKSLVQVLNTLAKEMP